MLKYSGDHCYPGVARAQWEHCITKAKVGVVTVMDKSQNSNQISLTYRDLWCLF